MPYEIFFGKKPDLTGIHPWGCKVHVHDTSGNKLQGHSKIGAWMGYDEESNAHRIYWAEKRSITVEHSVNFNFEDEVTIALLEGEISADINPDSAVNPDPAVNPNIDNSAPILRHATAEGAADNEDNVSEPQNPTNHLENRFHGDEPIPEPALFEPHCGSCICKESEYVRRLHNGTGLSRACLSDPAIPVGIQEGSDAGGAVDNESGEKEDEWEMVEVTEHAMAAVMAGAEGLTPTFEEAWKQSDWPKWEEAINKELVSLKANDTYKVVEHLLHVNIVKCCWVLRIKKNSAGEINKYKARLVAKGFTQVHSVDYYETYSPVTTLTSFRLLLALAARNNWEADIFDFDTAYLNSKLGEHETMYLEQPTNYETGNQRMHVWCLKKMLCGLKQGGQELV